ncbi:hypothetical protein [Bacillus sonorensis]|uniref:hypothetical protein n=1 Tax=Bacillus sonorensis TaxID=119858 RepID=UPI002280BA9A|nr:hypothetical protein [Bacillus sonorensis]MCY8604040.1 hypothetical protein [Bacillus sonorensis]
MLNITTSAADTISGGRILYRSRRGGTTTLPSKAFLGESSVTSLPDFAPQVRILTCSSAFRAAA